MALSSHRGDIKEEGGNRCREEGDCREDVLEGCRLGVVAAGEDHGDKHNHEGNVKQDAKEAEEAPACAKVNSLQDHTEEACRTKNYSQDKKDGIAETLPTRFMILCLYVIIKGQAAAKKGVNKINDE